MGKESDVSTSYPRGSRNATQQCSSPYSQGTAVPWSYKSHNVNLDFLGKKVVLLPPHPLSVGTAIRRVRVHPNHPSLFTAFYFMIHLGLTSFKLKKGRKSMQNYIYKPAAQGDTIIFVSNRTSTFKPGLTIITLGKTDLYVLDTKGTTRV